MWFRVEHSKDGSVKSVTEVEARGTDTGGLVCFVDAPNSESAVTAAAAWREKYLRDASEHRKQQRAIAKTIGRCRNCLLRDVRPGLLTCLQCSEAEKTRRNEAHVVVGGAGYDPELVREKIREIYGSYKVSSDTCAQAISGLRVVQDVAMRVARAVRELGGAATATRVYRGKQGGGRYSSQEHQLNMLLECQRNHNRMTRAQFSEWLESEIAKRRPVMRKSA